MPFIGAYQDRVGGALHNGSYGQCLPLLSLQPPPIPTPSPHQWCSTLSYKSGVYTIIEIH